MSATVDRLEHLQMLKDSAAGIAPRQGDFTRIRALRFTETGFDRAIWREMCEMGWLGLRIPESDGGSGLGAQEFCGLTEELGAALVPEPLIPAAMAASLLPPDQLGPVLAGERIVLAAWQEKPNSVALSGDTVMRDGRLSGRKLFVPMAAGADAFLVTVPGGVALVERDAPGVSLELQQTQDGGNFGSLTFVGAPAEAIDGDAEDALEHAIMASSAYLFGLMDRAFRITLGYMKTREQFGRKIGSFQALQHRAADMEIQIALTRATVASAAYALDNAPTVAQRRAAVSRAKVRASDAAMIVTRTCIQLHGGIGYTDAYDIGLFLRKAMVLAPLYGSPMVHRARFRAWRQRAMMTEPLPILTQRSIEAAFAKGIFDEMKAELGEATAKRILANAVIKLAKQAAAEMAKQAPGGEPSLDSFRAIQPRWTAGDALRIDVVTTTEREFHFNVTRCRYAEMYRAMGLAELGAILSCNRDGAFCEGYDPRLKLERTQTLMGGASHCDFRYRWQEAPTG